MSKVSVIIPTFNRAGLVGASIASCLRQSVENLEVIVVDDGSTDDTRDVVLAIGDPRIRYTYQENRGLPAARNAGFRIATGDYVALLDSDDLYMAGGLRSLQVALDDCPRLGLVAGGWQYIDANGVVLKTEEPWLAGAQLDLPAWLHGCPVLPCSVMVRRSWLDAAGGFDESLRQAEDLDLWLRLAYLDCPMAWVKVLVASYRIHVGQMTNDAVSATNYVVQVLEKFFAQPDLPADLAAQRDETVGAAVAREVPREIFVGQVGEGLAHLRLAIRLSPALLDRRAERLFQCLVGWAGHPCVPDRVQFTERFFDALSGELRVLESRRREAIAMAAAGQIFARGYRDPRHLRRLLLTLAFNDPRWITNRGLLSIAIRAHLDRVGQLLAGTRSELTDVACPAGRAG